ncbi:hypothetical protein SAMN05421810_10325 [Amycolatopsis arida]|uniref:Uncharacterized protein n=1 Tax=Amycolatopsis arida TaxID=587909 RepID=A0A1I5S6G9_9PSEU|nr:hypothetical protein [Amycolatopsis arida]TDX85298.1 hypothetical protein CLV69_11625 [Amycolatopsis arida]SFP66284.1 hypothetical protein SAMN05421810_10325 [Amycolatopsis arida]
MSGRTSPDLALVAAALRQISRGFAALADAVSPASEETTQEERYRAVLAEWGDRGLTRAEASALFRRHGFSPQSAGGWVRGEWLETRADGLRYLTERSRAWLREVDDRG